ncbi:MAG: cytochrome c-type biogenesis CcmF C-terminal domain-containing protein, partial [Rudaea sp.]
PIGGYDIRFERVSDGRGPNFFFERGHFTVERDGRPVATLTPEKRLYPVQGMPTSEAAIDSGLLRDVYVVLGDRQQDGDAWAVRAYVKPLANWIWLGALIMGLGGIVSLTDRRFRIAVTTRRPAASAPVAAE